MPILKNSRHEAFAQALARGTSAAAAYIEAGYKANAGNACTLKSQQSISKRILELQEEQLAMHQQATAEAAANAKVTIESLIADAEAARVKAMAEKGGAAAAVSALTAKANLPACGATRSTSTIRARLPMSTSSASLLSVHRPMTGRCHHRAK